MEMFLGYLGERLELEYARVVDENIEASESGFARCEKAVDAGLLRNVRLHGNGCAAVLGDEIDDAIGAFFAR